jgi:predicted phosphodiesterase
MSVGPTEVVVTFTSEPDEVVTTRVGTLEVSTTGPYHVAHVGGLCPDSDYELEVEGAPPGRWLPATVRTLPHPSGRLLATIATANDVHFGETECGRTGDAATDAIGPILRAVPGDPPYPELMNGAVVDEMERLDPDLVVVKGDLTDSGRPEEYEAFLAAYGRLGPRMRHVRGNHDAVRDPTLAVEGAPYVVQLAGVTVAVLDTTRPRATAGVLPRSQVVWLDEVAREANGPVLAFGHHPVWNVDDPRVDPDYAIERDDSVALLDVIARRDTIVGYFAGHTHTNRVLRLRGARDVPLVEVACTKDYPGSWAEYRVHEGGFTQVVRRVREPRAFAWAERARHMIQGVYGELVLGGIAERCFAESF